MHQPSECPQFALKEELVHDILTRTVGKLDPKWVTIIVIFLSNDKRQMGLHVAKVKKEQNGL